MRRVIGIFSHFPLVSLNIYFYLMFYHTEHSRELYHYLDHFKRLKYFVKLIFFWLIFSYAPWCPACKSLAPIWKEFSTWSEDLDIRVGQVDVTTDVGLSGRFMVTALPTIYQWVYIHWKWHSIYKEHQDMHIYFLTVFTHNFLHRSCLNLKKKAMRCLTMFKEEGGQWVRSCNAFHVFWVIKGEGHSPRSGSHRWIRWGYRGHAPPKGHVNASKVLPPPSPSL